MEISEVISYALISLGYLSYLFPVGYIFYKKGKNKFLYVSSCYGAVMLIGILMLVMAAPFLLFIVKVAPVLAENGHIIYIEPLLSATTILEKYAVEVIPPVLSVALSILMYRRYAIFI